MQLLKSIQDDSSLFREGAKFEHGSLMQSKDIFALDSFLKRESGSNTINQGELATPEVVECNSPDFLREINNSTSSRPMQFNLN